MGNLTDRQSSFQTNGILCLEIRIEAIDWSGISWYMLWIICKWYYGEIEPIRRECAAFPSFASITPLFSLTLSFYRHPK